MSLIDLSHPLATTAFVAPGLPAPKIEQLLCIPRDHANVTRVELMVHAGTHLDAPRHFIPDGKTIDALELDCATGSAVAWTVRSKPGEEITVDQLRQNRTDLRPGDLLFLHTGWDEKFADHASYADHPYLSVDAAGWLVEQGIRLLAVDTPSPDLPGIYRGEGFDWPVHRALLGSGVLIAEHLANLGKIIGRRFYAYGFPISIVDADGAPTRFVAAV